VQSDLLGVVDLRAGLLVDAVVGEEVARGRGALFAMLAWTRGEFEFVLCDVRGDAAPGARISHLLLEHAQLSDEKVG
jgi:hypothetical protein